MHTAGRLPGFPLSGWSRGPGSDHIGCSGWSILSRERQTLDAGCSDLTGKCHRSWQGFFNHEGGYGTPDLDLSERLICLRERNVAPRQSFIVEKVRK